MIDAGERVVHHNGVVTLTSRVLGRDARVAHGFAERGGGVSEGAYASLNFGPRSGDSLDNVRENRGRLLEALGLAGARTFAPRQAHSAEVSVHRSGEPIPEAGVFPGDALITDDRGVVLVVLAADCVPILVYDAGRQVIGVAHAGWRGTAGGIAGRTVRAMQERFGCRPEDVRVALGPSIGRCCYEVGPEVLAAVAEATGLSGEDLFDALPAGKGRLDLIAANRASLLCAGIFPHHIDATGLCTSCHGDRFFSHRRHGEPTGRGPAVIALSAEG
ncbi:MAG: peptidoglycan editing factor PgeF [Chloroflexi bacterium]|nr:peptidoglycan editing factor PgeF [Chloroflexota bacterium]